MKVKTKLLKMSSCLALFSACKPLANQNESANLSSLYQTGTVYQSHGPDSNIPNQSHTIVKASYTFPQSKPADIEKWIAEKTSTLDFEKGAITDALRSVLAVTPYDLSSYLFNQGILRLSKNNPVCGKNASASENEKVCWFQEEGRLVLAIGGSPNPARFLNNKLLRALVSIRNDLLKNLGDADKSNPSIKEVVEKHEVLASRLIIAFEKDEQQKAGYDATKLADQLLDLRRTGSLTSDSIDLFFGSLVKNRVLQRCYPNVYAVFDQNQTVSTIKVDEAQCAEARKEQADAI